MPDATQVQSFHDTIREWAYLGAQACANRETMQEHFGRSRLETKRFVQEGLERFTAGVHIWDGERQTGWGEGCCNTRQTQEGLGSPKGSSGASPKVMLERPGPVPS